MITEKNKKEIERLKQGCGIRTDFTKDLDGMWYSKPNCSWMHLCPTCQKKLQSYLTYLKQQEKEL